jgi:mono/diheme cytochrome c family protein
MNHRVLPAFLFLLVAPLWSQEGRPAAPPLADAKEQLALGLTLQIDAGGLQDRRDARLAALCVPEGTSPTPFLPPGPFKATWEGFISVDLGTDVTFTAVGNGSLTVTIADTKQALTAKGDLSTAEGPSIRLRKGRNKISVKYESPEKGDAVVRLYWTSTDFQREPVPPLVLSHDVNAASLRAQRRLREGRDLVATRRCLKCHVGDFKGMPELEMDAPSLAEAGARLHPDWIAKWVQNPRDLRPEATMPKLPGITPQDAADIAAYLVTLGKAEADPAPSADAAKLGGHLFVEMRCIACHTLPDKEPAADRIPFTFLKAKWKPAALKKFLLGPEKHYAWIEMPNFHLKEEEADRLAAFLLSRPGKAAEASGLKGDPARGKQQVESRGCVSCHKVADVNAFKATPIRNLKADSWAGGCKGADFGLNPAQVQAVTAFASTDLSSLTRDALPEFAERQFLTLRCFGCHRRDDHLEAWSEVASETKGLEPPKKEDDGEFAVIAAADPWFPSLTWIGEKLKPEWAIAFLKGEIAERPRPFLKNLRMPGFPTRAEGLIKGLSLEHGYPAASAPEPMPNAELSGFGRKLSGPNGGLDCLSCHAIGPKGATKVFEAPAPNFKLARARLRKEYYDRWVREPLRLEPGTKMPQFIKDGRTQLTEILDGDGVKQADALWNYLLEGDKIRPPE